MSESFIRKCVESGLNIRDRDFDNYLRDESKFTGHAEAVIVAASESDVAIAIHVGNETDTPITIASGRTSLTGAPVPLGGVVLDIKELSSMNPADPNKVGPGAILKEYKEFVDSLGFFYPPDPTSEDSCTIGGNVACNASGALSYLYGPTRNYIEGLKIVLPTGFTLNLKREAVLAENGQFKVPRHLLEPNPVSDLTIPAPDWDTPPWEVLKNVAGFYSNEHMDLVDLFIGSEGVLGAIVEITTKLLVKRRPYFSMIIFVPDLEMTVSFVSILNMLRLLNSPLVMSDSGNNQKKLCFPTQSFNGIEWSDFPLVLPSCMEWFGNSTATLLPDEHAHVLKRFYGAIFVEQEYDDPERMIEAAEQWSALIEHVNCSHKVTGKKIQTQVALNAKQSRAFRNLRQSVPEKLNDRIHPGFTKIGSDFSVPTDKLEDLLRMYEQYLPEQYSYVFGHIGNCHLHANMLPRTQFELQKAQDVMFEMSSKIVSLGGSIAGEHGIGKIKSKYLEMAVGNRAVRQMKRIKRSLDPKNILNRHTLFCE
ncbi:MAG: FAD-binding oxidoreductase [Desulfomonilaceae bacterium]